MESCFAELQNLFFFYFHRYGDEDGLHSLKESMPSQDDYKEIVIDISRKKNQLIYKTTMTKSCSSFPHKTRLSVRVNKKKKIIILKIAK